MICAKCQTDVSDDSRYCSVCGASMRGAVAVAEMPDPRTEAQLAEANLLRMRARWPEAEARCIDILRADPNNVHAHSLLGDIYRDQGRNEEAAQWYRLALDLNPSSAADIAKLSQIEQEAARQYARTLAASDRSHPADRSGTQKILGLAPTLWLRGLTAISVVFMVLVVILLVAMRNNRREEPITPTGTLSGPPATLPTPLPPNRPSPGTTGALPSSPPNTMADPPSPRPGAPPAADATGNAVAPSAPPFSPPAHGASAARNPRRDNAHSESEAALWAYLSAQSGLGAETTVGFVTIDPREQRVTVLLIRQQTEANASVARLRDAIARDALRVAQAAFLADPAYRRVTVSVRLGDPAGRVEPAFHGDIERAAAQGVSASAPTEQVLAAFAGVWWADFLMLPPPEMEPFFHEFGH